MTAVDLCRQQSDSLLKQLEKAMAGLKDETKNFKLHGDGVSAQEIAHHLGECLVALRAELKGDKHAWGGYAMEATTPDGQWAEYLDLREKVLGEAYADGSDRALRLVTDYVVLHDAYHVGQLCAARASQEGWDTFLVYS